MYIYIYLRVGGGGLPSAAPRIYGMSDMLAQAKPMPKLGAQADVGKVPIFLKRKPSTANLVGGFNLPHVGLKIKYLKPPVILFGE